MLTSNKRETGMKWMLVGAVANKQRKCLKGPLNDVPGVCG